MKHINESIIGRKGSVPGGLMTILKHPDDNDVLIVDPVYSDYCLMEDIIDDNDLKGIEKVHLIKGNSDFFVGTLKDLKKLHTPDKIDCDIYSFNINITTKHAVEWIKKNIDYVSNFYEHLDIISTVFSGEIKF